MKKQTKLWMAALCLIVPVTAMAAPTAACRAHGEAAFKAWTQGQYDKAGANFSPDIASTLTPDELKRVWGEVQESAGKLRGLGAFEPRTIQGHDVMAAPMRFAKGPLAAVFACDAKDRVNSFSVLNPALVPGLESMAPAASTSPH